jgi:hypothetical protein
MKKPAVILLKASNTRSCVTIAKLLGAERGDDLILRLDRGRRLGRNDGDLHPTLLVVRNLHKARVRDREPGLIRVAEEGRRFGVQADHLEGHPENLDLLADRVATRKQGFGQFVVDDGHPGAGRFLDWSEVATGQDGSSVHQNPARAHPSDRHALEIDALEPNRPPGVLTYVDAAHLRQSPDHLGLVRGEPGHPSPGRELIRAVRDLNALLKIPLHEEGLGPGGLQNLSDALVDAGDRGSHRNDHRHADRDSQDRQGGTHLVGAERIQRDDHALEHPGRDRGRPRGAHSALNATIGSSREARLAG